MDERRIDLAKYRLEKSKDELDASEKLLDESLYSQSLSNSYYAMLHVVRALLAFDKLDAKTHKGVIILFSKLYIKTNIFDVKYIKMLRGAKGKREEADYDDYFTPSKEEAETQLQNAKVFVPVIEAYIMDKIKK